MKNMKTGTLIFIFVAALFIIISLVVWSYASYQQKQAEEEQKWEEERDRIIEEANRKYENNKKFNDSLDNEIRKYQDAKRAYEEKYGEIDTDDDGCLERPQYWGCY